MILLKQSADRLCGLGVILIVLHIAVSHHANAQPLGSDAGLGSLVSGSGIVDTPVIGPIVDLASSLGGAAQEGNASNVYQVALSPINGTNDLLSDVERVLPGVAADPLPGLGSGGTALNPITDPFINNINVLGVAGFLNPILISANPLLTSVPVVGDGGNREGAGSGIFSVAEAVLASDLTMMLSPFPDSNPLNLVLLQFENTALEPITGELSGQSNTAINVLLIPLLGNLSGGLNTVAPAFGATGDMFDTITLPGDSPALPGLPQ